MRDADELDEYLRGAGELSRRYRCEPAPQPPHALDRLVLDAARPSRAKPDPRRSQSLAPLAFAASVFLSVALVLAIIFGPRTAGKSDERPRVMQIRAYRTEVPRAAALSPRERDPAAWLGEISALRRAGREGEADAEMRRFRSVYPDYIIPSSE